jgi:hypothetical protein
MELTKLDKEYIKNISTTYNIDESIVEKNYIEMIAKSQYTQNFKKIMSKIEANKKVQG